jgi:L-ascorbate 6-phosphate lactonase
MNDPTLDQLFSIRRGIGLCWLGNDGWVMRADGRLLAFDLDYGTPIRLREPAIALDELGQALDVLFISHVHGDHFNKPTCARLVQCSRCKFVVPDSCMGRAREVGIPEDRIVVPRPRCTFEIQGMRVLATRALHGHHHLSVYREANFDDCGYIFELAGLHVFQPGDSVLLHDHLELTGIDVLFISPTEHNMHVQPAATLIRTLRPRWIFPQHFGTYAVTPDNAFWTTGYPDELRAVLEPDLRPRFHKLREGQVFHIPSDGPSAAATIA